MSYNKRHKWNGKAKGNGNDYQGGLAVACVKCGCVKEFVQSKPTYFINDAVYDKAPPCDERLIKKVNTKYEKTGSCYCDL